MADYDTKTLPVENRSFGTKVRKDLCCHMVYPTEYGKGGSCGFHNSSGQCGNGEIVCCKTQLCYSATQATAHLGNAVCV